MFIHSSLRALYQAVWLAAMPVLRRHSRLREGFAERTVPPHWPYGEAPLVSPSGAAQSASSPVDAPERNDAPPTGTAPITPPPTEGFRLWIQAASGGEATLVRAIALALQRVAPASSLPITLLATTCTTQGLSVLRALEQTFLAAGATMAPAGTAPRPIRILPRHFPLDAPSTMRRALAQAAPHLLVLLETELWPGLLLEAKRAGIPYLVLNGRMTEKSVRGFSRFSSFFKSHAPLAVTATTENNADRFSRLFGFDRVEVVPNIKFSLALAMLDAFSQPRSANRAGALPTARELAHIGPELPLAVFASVRKEEEEALFPAICAMAGMKVNEQPVRCIVAPRHLHRVSAWKGRFARAGIQVCLRSSLNSDSPVPPTASAARVLLWDTFGELRAVYAAADAVTVGGSFAPLGGQNFLEPLAAGVLPLVGPSWENFDWVGEDIVAQGLLQIVPEPQALVGAMLCAMNKRLGPDPHHWTADRNRAALDIQARFRAFLQPSANGADQNARLILRCLEEDC